MIVNAAQRWIVDERRMALGEDRSRALGEAVSDADASIERVSLADDPFAEIDEIAARRRRKLER